MLPRQRLRLYCILLAVALVVLYNEFVIHWIQPWHWDRLDCEQDDHNCTKILLIADPQIQGEMAVSPPLSYLYNWDSDRYVKETFKVAMNYFEPDILIYLGDLMDEGSIANRQQFQRYLKRLTDIFYTDKMVMQVFVPGDNDIGGESERVSMERLRDFEKQAFKQPDVIKLEKKNELFSSGVVIYKLNRIAHLMPKIPEELNPREENFNIIVSHYPVVGSGIFAQKAIANLHPDLIFCGHDHTAKYVESPKGSLYAKTMKRISSNDGVLEINFNNNTLYEIYVPTCSYRMGVPNMGYGAAVLKDNNKQLRYSVYWSSSRFSPLFLYLFILIILFTYISVFFLCKLVCNRQFQRIILCLR